MSAITLGDLSIDELDNLLHRGLHYRIGPFTLELQNSAPEIGPLLHNLYADSPIAEDAEIADFHIRVTRPAGLRRWIRPKVNFSVDGRLPFDPFPLDTAFPLLEWGINWCIAMHSHQYLMLHAGIVEKNGKAVIFPAWPGSGKSTLCAALMYNGWRLLSDEFGLVRTDSTDFTPIPRCIPVKNQSIEVIRKHCPNAILGPTFPKTRKGDVAHAKPTVASMKQAEKSARAAFIIFPQYTKETLCQLKPISKPRAFMKLSHNSFNYELLGKKGFETVASIVEQCDCYLFEYSDLNKAVALFEELVSG